MASPEPTPTDPVAITFGEAWKVQHEVGPQLDHDPLCSSVPGHSAISGPGLLCDCGAMEAEVRRRRSADPTRPVPGPTREQIREALDDIFKIAAALARHEPFRGDDVADQVSDRTYDNFTRLATRLVQARDVLRSSPSLLPARPSPTDDDPAGVLSADQVELLRQAPAGQDVTARTQLAVSHENLRALLASHPKFPHSP